jgi:hypothetical protein
MEIIMPTSHHKQLNELIDLIILTNPKSILDVGIGFGKYGFLSREYLELWDGREYYSEWSRKIDGIEAFEEYITPIHKYIYNNIYIGNALELLSNIDASYDLILLIDVLEHFDFPDGNSLLNACIEKGRNVLISTPKDIGSQGGSFKNPYQEHKFQWRAEHFDEYPNKFFIYNEYSIICYIGKDNLNIRIGPKKAIPSFKILAKNNFPFLSKPYRILKRIMK